MAHSTTRTGLIEKRFPIYSLPGTGSEPFDTLEFDARSPLIEGSQWFRLANGGPGVGISPGEQVGWRLTEDPASEIVFYMTDNPVFWTVTYTGSDENAPNVISFANIGAAVFTASVNTSATSDDSIWASHHPSGAST
ncbi:hypothetical protein B0H16DRAFT_1453557 [Mycena metata]|uniref:Uncharacterized protein n=1 Tax=Mycena metata TaxID=1033252 RepID=A0AAD7JLR6_9AGAR|nr:hypothetical protein B0H16DRAFT_1453557 [Mycena metata]